MASWDSAAMEEGAVNRIIRRLSSMISPIKPRIMKARSKSIKHVSSTFESLDYDVWTNELLVKEEQSKSYSQVIEVDILRWILFLLVGIFTGLIAVFINISIHFLHTLQFHHALQYIKSCTNGYCEFLNYVIWYLTFGLFTLLGTALVVFIEPGAAGSGIPFIVSYLNGVCIPHITTVKVLIVKAIGVIFSCVAGLATGKEGPLIHIGSIIGGVIAQGAQKIKIPWLEQKVTQLNNSREKRDLIAAGFAAGVAAAFSSPVGATLLILEEGTSFWSVLLMWRIFFCAIASTFTFNSIIRLILNDNGLFRFGRFQDTELDYSLAEMPLFFIVGSIGGVVGAFYIFAATKVTFYRKRYINNPTLQLLDSALLSLVTAMFGIISIYSLQNCVAAEGAANPMFSFQLSCQKGFYNEMSALWLQSQENLLKLIFHSDIFQIGNLSLYCISYLILFIMVNGIQIPSGVFIPALVIGATWGRIFGLVLLKIFPQLPATIPIKYALLGAAAQLGGLLRTTLSLSVLLVEASGSIIFGFPLMFTLFTTKWVGDFFSENLYQALINIMGVPLLPSDPPPLVSDFGAKDVMNTKVVSFPTIVSVQYILEVLISVKHQGFPVVIESAEAESDGTSDGNDKLRTFGELQGFIYRHQLMTILHCKLLSLPEAAEQVSKMVSLFRKYEFASIQIQDLNLSEDEKQKIMDLKPFINPSPYSVQTTMSFPRIFRLLRNLGLRHVIVVDNKNQVVGIITRKDLAKYRCWRHAASMGLKELRVR